VVSCFPYGPYGKAKEVGAAGDLAVKIILPITAHGVGTCALKFIREQLDLLT